FGRDLLPLPAARVQRQVQRLPRRTIAGRDQCDRRVSAGRRSSAGAPALTAWPPQRSTGASSARTGTAALAEAVRGGSGCRNDLRLSGFELVAALDSRGCDERELIEIGISQCFHRAKRSNP